jgi:hypothetical protein
MNGRGGGSVVQASHLLVQAETPAPRLTKPPVAIASNLRGEPMNEEASYNCDSCGEEIVVPIDLSAGSVQKYVEDCPVCCCPNVIHLEIAADGDVRVWAERE